MTKPELRTVGLSDPYRPPDAVQAPAPPGPRPPLARVAVSYGVVGLLTVVVLGYTLGPALLGTSTSLRFLVGPWTAAGAASFIVPALVHAVVGRLMWRTALLRALLAMLCVFCAVEACVIGDLLVITVVQSRDLLEPGLLKVLGFEAALGVGIAPVGLLPGWLVERWM